MALAILASGTQTATIGTEHTLDTDTTGKTDVLVVDTGAMVAGDEVALRLKTKVLSGGTEREAYIAHYFGAQAQPQKYSVPVPANISLAASLKQGSGTFAIDSIVGTINYGDAVTGQTSGAKGRVFPLGGGNVAGSSVVIRVDSGTFNGAETVEKDGDTGNTFNTTDAGAGRAFPWALLSLD